MSSYNIENAKKFGDFTVIGSVPNEGIVLVHDGNNVKAISVENLVGPTKGSGAGVHNAIYRGKSLGSTVTASQYAAIQAGTFDDLFIGDYWTIGGVKYRIAAFDYYLTTGDTACNAHHVTLVPDTALYSAQMQNTESGQYEAGAANTTEGAYVNSDMYTTNLEQAKTIISNAFGSAHILNHRQLLPNATTNGYEVGFAWYDSIVELMTEHNVYGGKIFKNAVQGTNFAYSYTIDKSQYPLFAMRPDLISNRVTYWLRDVASATNFCCVNNSGDAFASDASCSFGVRPAFSIKS